MWIFILILVLLNPFLLYSEEDVLLIGEVSSINLEKKEIFLFIKEDCKLNSEILEKIPKKDNTNKIIEISVQDDTILRRINQGDIIRVWVSYDDPTKKFIATTITKPGKFVGGRDQTGIRRRLEHFDSDNSNLRRRHGR